MASYQQMFYCKNCKKNVHVNDKGQCAICHSTQMNKSWSVRFRYVESNGKEVQKRLSGFSTKKEAQAAELEFKVQHKTNYKKLDQLSFVELFNDYEKFIKTRTKASTHYDFKSKTEGHILPYFKDYNVIDITPKIILEWQNTLEKFSYNYKCHLRTCLSGMLRYAEKYYDIPNQLRKVDNFRNLEQEQEMSIWTPEEFEKAMSFVKDKEYKVFYTALYLTGARKGEMLATSWNDWDFDKKILNINKSVSKKVTGAQWIVTTPKNKSSNRKIRIPDYLIEIMKDLYVNKLNENKIGQFVFGNEKPLPETCICRYLTKAANDADIKVIRIHDLRHSHASYLLSKGISVVAVAKRLGHSNIEQTLNTYAHLLPEDNESLINRLENLGTFLGTKKTKSV